MNRCGWPSIFHELTSTEAEILEGGSKSYRGNQFYCLGGLPASRCRPWGDENPKDLDREKYSASGSPTHPMYDFEGLNYPCRMNRAEISEPRPGDVFALDAADIGS